MRKLAVSLVTLTSLTACSQGDELGTHWSFELPDGLATDEEFAQFREQLATPRYDQIASVAPLVNDVAQPGFTPGGPVAAVPSGLQFNPPNPRSLPSAELDPNLTAQLEAEFELVEESAPGDPTDWSSEAALEAEPSSDLALDEVVELNFPQRGPRPDPLAPVRFSQSNPVTDNRGMERLLSATPTQSAETVASQRPTSLTQAVPVAPSAFVTEQSHRVELNLRNHTARPELTPAIDLSLNDDFGLTDLREPEAEANVQDSSETISGQSTLNSDEVGLHPVVDKRQFSERWSSLAELTETTSKVSLLEFDTLLSADPKRFHDRLPLIQSAQFSPRLAIDFRPNDAF